MVIGGGLITALFSGIVLEGALIPHSSVAILGNVYAGSIGLFGGVGLTSGGIGLLLATIKRKKQKDTPSSPPTPSTSSSEEEVDPPSKRKTPSVSTSSLPQPEVKKEEAETESSEVTVYNPDDTSTEDSYSSDTETEQPGKPSWTFDEEEKFTFDH